MLLWGQSEWRVQKELSRIFDFVFTILILFYNTSKSNYLGVVNSKYIF